MTEKFELGRLVATGAIEATTLRQHFNLVARHARASRRASLRYARLEARGSPTPNQGFAALFSHQPQNFSYVYEVGLLQRLAGAPMAETQIEWTDATWNPVAQGFGVTGSQNCNVELI